MWLANKAISIWEVIYASASGSNDKKPEVVYNERAANAFSAEIKYRHCMRPAYAATYQLLSSMRKAQRHTKTI